jgi:DNA-binding response OmpR family regulator
MESSKTAKEPDLGRNAHHAEYITRFGDLELDRYSVVVRGPKGTIDLSLGEFRACALLVEAAGATVRWAELAIVSGIEVRNGHHALELTISRLRSHLRRRGSAANVETTYGVGWKLVATSGSHANP